MSDYFNIAEITSVEPASVKDARPGGSSEHQFTLNINVPSSSLEYPKLEIYRYIADIGEDGSNFTLSNDYLIETITEEVSAITEFVDDLSSFYDGTALNTLHGIYGYTSDVANDKQLLDEIYYSQRAIHYAIRSFTEGSQFDSIPYVVTSHTEDSKIKCTSTKTQVRHNILHLEGAVVWETNLRKPGGGLCNKVSRTSVDVNRIFEDEAHRGVNGIGGNVWVSSRSNPAYVCRCRGRDGALEATFKLNSTSDNGVGLAATSPTGNAMAGGYGDGDLVECSQSAQGNFNASKRVDMGNGQCYGMTVQANDPTIMWWSENLTDVYKFKNTSTGWKYKGSYDFKAAGSNEDHYGLCTGPDGAVFRVSWNSGRMTWIAANGGLYSVSNIMYSAGQNRGVTTDIPNLYPNLSDRYNVYAGGSSSRYLSRAEYIPSSHGFSGNKSQKNLGAGIYGVGVDAENNIWCAGRLLKKVYHMEDGTNFPLQGECRYPNVEMDRWWAQSTNTKEIDWFLTRDTDTMNPTVSAEWASYTESPDLHVYGINGSVTHRYGLKVKGATTEIQLANVNAWNTLYGSDSANTIGREVYPGFINYDSSYTETYNGHTGTTRVKDFTSNVYNNVNYSYMYSDFTGSILIGSLEYVPAPPSYGHPGTTPITVDLKIEDTKHSNGLNEVGYYWEDKQTVNNLQATAFDELTVNLSATVNPGSFIVSSWDFNVDDYEYDYGNTVSNTVSTLYTTNLLYNANADYITSLSHEHVYNDTSKIGLSGLEFNDSRNINGEFNPLVYVESNLDPYTFAPVNAYSNNVDIAVKERWPTARFWINHVELSAVRYDWFSCPISWKPTSRFVKSINYSNVDFYKQNTIAWGTDPLSATFWDRSIARTYPVDTLYFDVSTTCIYSDDFADWTPVTDTKWKLTSSFEIPLSEGFLPKDTVNSDSRGVNSRIEQLTKLYRYGEYSFTMYNQASTTDTLNADLSGTPYTWTQLLCVKEFEPFANFWAISAQTVPANYSDDTRGVAASTILEPVPDPIWTLSNNFVSGYAPNLTVWFTDSSEAHTFPISSYHWNFGDYYDNDTNEETILTTSHTGNFDAGCWTMDKTNHTVKHTYTMPGVYDVTLCVEASNTATQDCCARYVDSFSNFYVFVDEYPPSCCYEISDSPTTGFGTTELSGVSPVTLYFLASCSTTGSFPICRIDYDWGDGSPIETISRTPFTGETNLGNTLLSINAFLEDPEDPRNQVISHTFTNEYDVAPQTFTPTLTVYACNTHTNSICPGQAVGPVLNPNLDLIEPRHLISSRFKNTNNDVVYVLEGEGYDATYTVLLSGEK